MNNTPITSLEKLAIEHKVGVYCILNNANGKFYVGSAKDVKKRISEHMLRLRRGTHENKSMLTDFREYGESAFTAFAVCYCEDIDIAVNKEQFYINSLGATNMGYNVLRVARKGFYSDKSVKELRTWSTDPEKLAKRNEAIRNSDCVRETLKRINSSPEHKAQVQRMLEQVHNDPRIQGNVRGLAQKNIRDADWMAAHNQRIIERVSPDGEIVETYISLNSIPKPYSKWTVSRICKRGLHELHCGFYWRFQD